MAGMTTSQSMVKLEPSIGTGLRRPDASGSPRAMRWNSTPAARPFFSMIRTGAAKNSRRMPSCSASSTSL